jgi:hypothetical protein
LQCAVTARWVGCMFAGSGLERGRSASKGNAGRQGGFSTWCDWWHRLAASLRVGVVLVSSVPLHCRWPLKCISREVGLGAVTIKGEVVCRVVDPY